MTTKWHFRNRSDGERNSRDDAAYRKDRMLHGLNHTGTAFDRMKPYPGQSTELRGIQNRINRINSGREKV